MNRFITIGLALLICFSVACRNEDQRPSPKAPAQKDPKLDSSRISTDETLLLAAVSALGDRKGSIIVLDAGNGRVRAVVNKEYAWEHDYPIGSVIKPFVAAAMLHDRSLNPEEPFLCPGRIKIGNTIFRCSHPLQKEPINLERAIALSCNCYFAHLADALNIDSLRRELQYRGFGKITDLNADNERAGKLAAIGDDAQRNALIAIGETDEITTTPIELSVAMLSLVGGKSPLKPHIGDIKTPIAERPGEPTSSSILIGMRGCLEYGTGTKQRNWKELPFTVIGKTGTPTIPGNTVTYGWFSGVSMPNMALKRDLPESSSPCFWSEATALRPRR